MPHTVEAVFHDELRRAGLSGRGPLPRLLALLRGSTETHLTLTTIADMAVEAGLAVTSADLLRHLDSFVEHGLISRLPTTTSEPVFDTEPEAHFHLVYDDTEEITDLHVSGETLLAMLRDALAHRPESVEVLLRFRRDSPPAA